MKMLAHEGKGVRQKRLTDLDISTSIKKNVVTLDVSVNDVLLMQVFKALACLSKVLANECGLHLSTYLETDGGDLILSNVWVVINDICQSTTLHELHYNP